MAVRAMTVSVIVVNEKGEVLFWRDGSSKLYIPSGTTYPGRELKFANETLTRHLGLSFNDTVDHIKRINVDSRLVVFFYKLKPDVKIKDHTQWVDVDDAYGDTRNFLRTAFVLLRNEYSAAAL